VIVRWLLGGTLLLASCAGSLPHPPYCRQANIALRRVDSVPPPGRVETIPERPSGADAWVDGEWVLEHGRWYWLLGRWVKNPPDTAYCPWVVVRASDGTPFYAPSVWRDARGQAAPGPPPLAFATAAGEAVMSPEGVTEDTGRAIKVGPSTRPPPEDQPDSQAPSATP
jgi:hypothetical protein